MKLILSRKGFDSSAGGCPSPILPDGRLLSLPIPLKNATVTYADIQFDGESIGPIVEQLTRGRIPQTYLAHLDPDLRSESLSRRPGWRPIFGQTGAAQSHLQNNGVCAGDLFLFFGLFRRTTRLGGRLAWKSDEHRCHVLWGWLQVDEVLSPNDVDMKRYAWATDHPHFHRGNDPKNTIYIARERLDLGDGSNSTLPGAGVFSHYAPELQLTAANEKSLTDWELPAWFFPSHGRTPITYTKLECWQHRDGHARLNAPSRGQEFVLDCNDYPESAEWLVRLIRTSS